MPTETSEVEFLIMGKVISKKNLYKRKRGSGFYLDEASRKLLDDFKRQVPAFARDLMLVHPEMEVWFTVAKQNADRDNKFTALLDLLRDTGTIKNDNIKSFNGKLTIHPAEIAPGQEESTRVLLRRQP